MGQVRARLLGPYRKRCARELSGLSSRPQHVCSHALLSGGMPQHKQPLSPCLMHWGVVKYGQAWSSMAKHGQAWSNMVKHGQAWSSMAKHGQKRTNACVTVCVRVHVSTATASAQQQRLCRHSLVRFSSAPSESTEDLTALNSSTRLHTAAAAFTWRGETRGNRGSMGERARQC